MQESTIDGIVRFRFLMNWISPEKILSGGNFIEVNDEDFDKFISTINYRRKSYMDCTIYYNSRDEKNHLAYHYDTEYPHRYFIKTRRI